MNLGDFIDKFKDAIARRVVESYPPLYRPSENGGALPSPAPKAPGSAGRRHQRRGPVPGRPTGAPPSSGEMGTGKTFIGAAAAYMAGFQRVLILCPPHLVPKWKREVEMTVPGARAAIVESITDLEMLRFSIGSGTAVRGDEQGEGQAVLPLEGRRHRAVGHVEGQAHQGRGDGGAVPGSLLPGLHGAGRGQGRSAPDGEGPQPQEAHLRRAAARPCGRPTGPGPSPLPAQPTTSSTG